MSLPRASSANPVTRVVIQDRALQERVVIPDRALQERVVIPDRALQEKVVVPDRALPDKVVRTARFKTRSSFRTAREREAIRNLAIGSRLQTEIPAFRWNDDSQGLSRE